MAGKKVDLNHRSIRGRLRDLGFIVEDTSKVGRNFPDLLTYGLNHKTGIHQLFLIEVKSKNGKLSQGQQEFSERFRGAVITAHSLDDVLRAYEWKDEEIQQVVEASVDG